jgi:hypothetical protein
MKNYALLRNRTLRLALVVLPLYLGSPVSIHAEEESSTDNWEAFAEKAAEFGSVVLQRVMEMSGEEEASGETAYMGIVIESVPDVLRDYINLPDGVGLLLTHIAKDGPAYKAGIKDNDILVAFDDQLIVNFNQLSTLIDLKGAGTVVPVEVLRKGKSMTLEVTLETRIRKGNRFVLPEPPSPPDYPEAPGVPDSYEEAEMLLTTIENWIPGSVRVFLDENEQVHVDLAELKEDLGLLKAKLESLTEGKGDHLDLSKTYGDGARQTIVHMQDHNIRYETPNGKLVIMSSDAGRQLMFWDAEGEFVYQGAYDESSDPANLPASVQEVLKSFQESQAKMRLDEAEVEINIQMNDEATQPTTQITETRTIDLHLAAH